MINKKKAKNKKTEMPEEITPTPNNVIMFPKRNKRLPQADSLQDLLDQAQQVHEVYVCETLDNIVPVLLKQLTAAGYDVNNVHNGKDIAFFIEALRSFMLKNFTIDHPFQTVSKNVFEFSDENKTILKIVDKLNVDLAEPT